AASAPRTGTCPEGRTTRCSPCTGSSTGWATTTSRPDPVPEIHPPRTADDVLAGVDLDGKVVVVTGASAGLGREAARALAARGAEVVAAVRDPAKVGGDGPAVALDLAALASVRAAAATILAGWPRVDVLVNNAGVMATPEGRTAEGFELQL